jgi:hypothetical protein
MRGERKGWRIPQELRPGKIEQQQLQAAQKPSLSCYRRDEAVCRREDRLAKAPRSEKGEKKDYMDDS